jgi:hypothetical protein
MGKFTLNLSSCPHVAENQDVLKAIEVIERPLGREKAMGLAWIEDRRVEIDSRLESKDFLDTLIHELLHIYNPDWKEQKVASTATQMTNLIWAKNYRRIKE